MDVKAKPKGTLSIKVIRADGTVEDHGVVASTEDGSITFGEQIKEAWREGWQKGKKDK